MKFELHSLKGRTIVNLIITLFITFIVIVVIVDFDLKRRAKEALNNDREAFKNLVRYETRTLSAVLEALAANQEIARPFAERDRERLREIAAPFFESLESHYQISAWTFFPPEQTGPAFLQLKKRGPAGDAGVTPLAPEATAVFPPTDGLHLSAAGLVLQVTLPIYYQNRLAGYMVLDEETGNFLAVMKKQSGSEFGLLVRKDALDKNRWAETRAALGLKGTWEELKNPVLLFSTAPNEPLPAVNRELAKIPEPGLLIKRTKAGKKFYMSGIFPVYDAGAQPVGGIITRLDFTYVYNTFKLTLLLILGIILVVAGLSYYTLNKTIFSRLNRLSEVATRVVGGDFEVQIVPSADDEIGKFEALFEQLRAILVHMIQELEAHHQGKQEGDSTDAKN